MYIGQFLGVNYIGHHYKPDVDITLKLINEFPFKWNIGDDVIYRKRHRKTTNGIITNKAYSSEGFCGGQNGGGTVKVYEINDKKN